MLNELLSNLKQILNCKDEWVSCKFKVQKTKCHPENRDWQCQTETRTTQLTAGVFLLSVILSIMSTQKLKRCHIHDWYLAGASSTILDPSIPLFWLSHTPSCCLSSSSRVDAANVFCCPHRSAAEVHVDSQWCGSFSFLWPWDTTIPLGPSRYLVTF